MTKNFQCTKQVLMCHNICGKFFSTDLKVVSLYGRSQKGKTPTLCALIDMMCVPTSKFDLIHMRKRKTSSLDKTCIFQLKGSNKIVGVTTIGDYCHCLAQEFDWIKSNNGNESCDLYVCASHINGSTVNWLQARTKDGYLLRLSKTAVEKSVGVPHKVIIDENTFNIQQAENLYKIIIDLL